MLVERALPEALTLIRVILSMLSTRLGTLLLCGSLCLNKKWPFINNFSNISLENREKVIQKWLKHRFLTPVRLVFIYIKVLCLIVFFSRVMPFSSFTNSHQYFFTFFSNRDVFLCIAIIKLFLHATNQIAPSGYL